MIAPSASRDDLAVTWVTYRCYSQLLVYIRSISLHMAWDAAGEHWGAGGVGEYTAHAYVQR